LLNIEVRNKLLKEGGAYSLRPRAKLHRVLAVSDRDIYRNLSGVTLISGMFVVAFVTAASVGSGLGIVNKFIEIGAGGF
jgi:hypothetical protein